MQKRLGDKAQFTVAEEVVDGHREWLFEDAAQQRKIFEVPHPDTGEIIRFAITAKPDGFLDYEGSRLLFEYKTKATGIVAMNGKLNYGGPQDDHLRQVTAESIVFGINEGILMYESTEKPSWFSDEEKSNVPKTRKTWADGEPISDLRPFYFKITEAQQQALLSDLAKQAQLVYEKEVVPMTVELTGNCGFCPFGGHCKALLTAEEKDALSQAERNYAKSSQAGKYAHNNLRQYLSEVKFDE